MHRNSLDDPTYIQMYHLKWLLIYALLMPKGILCLLSKLACFIQFMHIINLELRKSITISFDFIYLDCWSFTCQFAYAKWQHHQHQSQKFYIMRKHRIFDQLWPYIQHKHYIHLFSLCNHFLNIFIVLYIAATTIKEYIQMLINSFLNRNQFLCYIEKMMYICHVLHFFMLHR